MDIAAANTLGVSVNPVTAIILSILATLGACGASGVAVGFIIGIVQDSVETALNSSGDMVFTATAEFRERMQKPF